jgi:hypothetical protein
MLLSNALLQQYPLEFYFTYLLFSLTQICHSLCCQVPSWSLLLHGFTWKLRRLKKQYRLNNRLLGTILPVDRSLGSWSQSQRYVQAYLHYIRDLRNPPLQAELIMSFLALPKWSPRLCHWLDNTPMCFPDNVRLLDS